MRTYIATSRRVDEMPASLDFQRQTLVWLAKSFLDMEAGETFTIRQKLSRLPAECVGACLHGIKCVDRDESHVQKTYLSKTYISNLFKKFRNRYSSCINV